MAEEMFSFPSPPCPEATEWPGTPLGISNTITKTKGRTQTHDKDVDAKPGLLDRLLDSVSEHRAAHIEEPVYEHDVAIHGIKVRALTNGPHLYDFWVDNWFSLAEWKQVTGKEVLGEPRVMVYAFGGVAKEKEAAYYSRKASTIVFFNTSYYGQLKSWVLGAVGRILAEDYGIHSIHGACVARGDKGILYIAPTGTGKSTASYGIMDLEGARFHSDDWVYVRYTYGTRQGLPVSPIKILHDGKPVAKGYQVYKWLEKNGRRKDAQVIARDLKDNDHTLTVADLDLSKPPKAYAYTSEKIFYLRTNLVENFPETLFALLASKMENVPQVSPAFLEAHGATLDSLVEAMKERPQAARVLKRQNSNEIKLKLATLIAHDNARAMLDITSVFPKESVFYDPTEPVMLTSIMLIKRDFDQDVVMESLPLSKFMSRLLIGETPMRTREIAYNAYRAVDDSVEMNFVRDLEKELAGKGANPLLYEVYEARQDIPETLYEEFELFRVMHQAGRAYNLNTVLQKDPDVKSKLKAVNLTMKLIARIMEEEPVDLTLSVKDYSQFAH